MSDHHPLCSKGVGPVDECGICESAFHMDATLANAQVLIRGAIPGTNVVGSTVIRDLGDISDHTDCGRRRFGAGCVPFRSGE